MILRRTNAILLSGALFSCLIAISASADSGSAGRTYAITITNLTKAQVLTPAIVATHSRDFRIFEVGGEADEALYTMAETGSPALLVAQLEGESSVHEVMAGAGVIQPGTSETIYIKGNARNPLVTVMGMLATTNDSFYAAQGLRLSRFRSTADALVYDAGSEDNNEACDSIPGPPCGGASNDRNTAQAEEFIHLSNGIQGVGDLIAADLDWRGPAARIQIRRAH